MTKGEVTAVIPHDEREKQKRYLIYNNTYNALTYYRKWDTEELVTKLGNLAIRLLACDQVLLERETDYMTIELREMLHQVVRACVPAAVIGKTGRKPHAHD